MKAKTFYLRFVPIILLLFSSASGSGEKIPWCTINGGGTIYSSAADKKLCGSVAQSMAGRDTSTTQKSYAGFWNPWVRQMTPVEGEDENHAELPGKFDLRQNYPNPFNPATVIEYAIPKSTHVTIEIYNLLGQKVNILIDQDQKAGFYRMNWDGKNRNGEELASGIYFYRIQAGDFVKCRKMIMLK